MEGSENPSPRARVGAARGRLRVAVDAANLAAGRGDVRNDMYGTHGA